MTARSTAYADDLQDQHDSHDEERERYLGSHRALTACTREFARLAEDVRTLVDHLRSPDDDVDLRITPGRCIVQLGPVALTLSWLRSTLDSVADGRLLVVAWRGTVGGGVTRGFEQARPRAESRAVSIWEEVLVADATGDGDWHWRPEADASHRFDSRALAERCVAPLRKELAAAR